MAHWTFSATQGCRLKINFKIVLQHVYLLIIILQPNEIWQEGECLSCKCQNGKKKCGHRCDIDSCPNVCQQYKLFINILSCIYTSNKPCCAKVTFKN
jgi:hypothetical protein